MIINTDYEMLKLYLAQLKSKLEYYGSTFNDTFLIMNQHCGIVGKDGDKYAEQAEVLKENIDKMIGNLNALAADIDYSANLYKKTANDILPHASKF